MGSLSGPTMRHYEFFVKVTGGNKNVDRPDKHARYVPAGYVPLFGGVIVKKSRQQIGGKREGKRENGIDEEKLT